MSRDLILTDAVSGGQLQVPVHRVVVVGFAGRDAGAVHAHLDELREIGVAVPSATPTFYLLDPELLAAEDRIRVAGNFTSGEVEPVVVRHQGHWYLTVGSDHTDREVEVTSIHDSKAACAKPIASRCVAVAHLPDWDSITLRSWADEVEYQAGTLADLLPLDDIVQAAGAAGITFNDGDVVYLGTVPVRGKLRPAETFRVALDTADHSLGIEYHIDLVGEDANA